MKEPKTMRIQIRCTPDWYERIKERAKEKGVPVTKYVTTCIALGECVLDGTFREEDEEE